MENNIYTHRYIARVIIVAETPLFVCSGETSLLTDAIVMRDTHGFPMIPGTSLAGVLRHSLEDNTDDKETWKHFFGYQENKNNEGEGSKVKISSAYLILEKGKVAEGLNPAIYLAKYKKYFEELPVRQHVKINHRGVASDKNLFDNEVVYKGAKFLFEIELKGDANDQEIWEEFLSQLNNPLFRIGQGTRKGYGKLKVESIKERVFDLRKDDDFDAYLNFDPSLNAENTFLEEKKLTDKEKNLIHYQLKLTPESFFIFSAGYGDEEADNIPVTENVLIYDENNTLKGIQKQTLIPGSSIKGALRHRTAFHYNKKNKFYADTINKNLAEYIETNNQAVFELFGAEEGVKDERTDRKGNRREGYRGKVIINDIFIPDSDGIKNDKIFNHVAIDRFTGGAMEGALFSEKVSYFEDKNHQITIDIFVENNGLSENVLESFEDALRDVCKGLLPLGGMTTKGHGIFTGELFKNNEKIFSYENQ